MERRLSGMGFRAGTITGSVRRTGARAGRRGMVADAAGGWCGRVTRRCENGAGERTRVRCALS